MEQLTCRQCKKTGELSDMGFCSEVCHKQWQEENYATKNNPKIPRTLEFMMHQLQEWGQEEIDKRNNGQRRIV